ncbi:MAG: hypothetical protein ABSG05_00095 [Candidatus Pacearchaeota archaeon]
MKEGFKIIILGNTYEIVKIDYDVYPRNWKKNEDYELVKKFLLHDTESSMILPTDHLTEDLRGNIKLNGKKVNKRDIKLLK